MPLLKGKKNIGHNIEEMRKAGHPEKQAIAAAEHAAQDELENILASDEDDESSFDERLTWNEGDIEILKD